MKSLTLPIRPCFISTALCAILFSFVAMAQINNQIDFQTDDINSPSTSLRCYELNKRRQDKIDHKQNLKSLISRNDRLLKVMNEEEDQKFYLKLLKNKTRLRFELELALQKILNAEEALVKTGCPNLLQ